MAHLPARDSVAATLVASPKGERVRIESGAAPLPAGTDTKRPRKIGPYVIQARLGEGSMGEVFRAEHEALGRVVALKLLRPELSGEPEYVHRFFDEARAVNLVRSGHVVEVYDLRSEPTGETYLVMEYVEGRDLAATFRDRPLTLVQSLEVVRQLCDALEPVHEAGIVHRDIKPENVLICAAESALFAKLIDFGIAKLKRLELSAGGHTAPGMVVGTPRYMAPEQATASAVDHRCDIYALGVMLFEAISGRAPFESESNREMMMAIAELPAPRLSQFADLPPRVRKPLDALVESCLRKSPDARPRSVAHVRKRIDAILRRMELPAHTSLPPSVRRPSPWTRGIQVASGLAAAGVFVGTFWYATDDRPPSDELPVAGVAAAGPVRNFAAAPAPVPAEPEPRAPEAEGDSPGLRPAALPLGVAPEESDIVVEELEQAPEDEDAEAEAEAEARDERRRHRRARRARNRSSRDDADARATHPEDELPTGDLLFNPFHEANE